MEARSIGHLWAKLLIKSLIEGGCKTVCIAPGSRSTCLVLAAEEADISIVTHFDERSLGFFALGCSKENRVPVAVMTTSGSAVANLIPSALEAYHMHCPVIFITADRPEELKHCGANQTCDQPPLLKSSTYSQFLLPIPSDNKDEIQNYCNTLYKIQTEMSQGPIHINMPFREPFIEDSVIFV